MIISLNGKKRSGKDTVADHLVENYGFTKLGLADPLRDMLYKLDPLVRQLGGQTSNLADLVDKHGWEWCKRYAPMTRDLLQRLGTECIRELDEDFWCWELDKRVEQLPRDADIVIPDARFENECRWFKETEAWGVVSQVWRITRLGQPDNDTHASEAGVPDEVIDRNLSNFGTKDDLLQQVDLLMAGSGRFPNNGVEL